MGWINIMLSVLVMLNINGDDILSRVNYGIFFTPTGKFPGPRSTWRHTFKINLPSTEYYRKLPNLDVICPEDTDRKAKIVCGEFKVTMERIKQVTDVSVMVINQTMTYINEIMPSSHDYKSTVDSRRKRAILSFIGDIEKSLFGSATMKDIDTLTRQINAIEHNQHNFNEGMNMDHETMESFITTMDKRLGNAFAGMQQNHESIVSLKQSIEQSMNIMNHEWIMAVRILTDQSRQASQIQRVMNNFYDGINRLIDGHITPQIISAEILQESLKHIKNKLQKHHPEFKLYTDSISYYYNNRLAYGTKSKGSIYVTLKVPITTLVSDFNLYKISVLPVPINHTTSHVTKISSLPDYLAINQNNNNFIEISQENLECSNIINNNLCHDTNVIQTSNSCSSALFLDSKLNIHNLCHIQFIANHAKPSIFLIQPGSILATNISNIILSCQNEPLQQLNGCQYCIINIPCHCSAKLNNYYIPSNMETCHSAMSESPTLVYPVNLALLQNFFEEDELSHIMSDSTYKDVFQFKIPHFKLYNHNLSNIVAKEEELHLSLKQMTQRAIENKPIFKSISEPILSGEWKFKSDSWMNYSIFDFILISLNIILIVVSIYMFRKQQRLYYMLSTMSKIKLSNALQPTLVWKAPTSVTPTTAPRELDSVIPSYHPLYLEVLSCILIGIIAIYIIIKIKQSLDARWGATKLMLEITNGRSCIHVPVLKMNMCPKYNTLEANKYMSGLSVEGTCMSPVLDINWHCLVVTDTLTMKPLNPPNSIPISHIQAFYINKILQTPFRLYLFYEHKGTVEYAPKIILKDNKEDVTLTMPDKSLYPDLKSL